MSVNKLLRRTSEISEKEEALQAEAFSRGERFNVFRLCRVDHYENTHSAILAEWLNPSGSHGQGDLFLRLFLEGSEIPFPKDFKTATAKVLTEYSTEKGRLDILIEDNEGKAVIIENKIYAADQDAQLKRYEEFAKQTYQNGYSLLYLTLNGTEPSKQSSEGVNYVTISYQSTILGWIERCIREVYDKPFLREALAQYGNLIKQLTGQDMDNKTEKELIAWMLQEPEGVAAIIKAYPQWERTVLETKLFSPLEEFSKQENLKLEIGDRFWSKATWGEFSFMVQPNLWIEFQYERQGRNDFYYGILDKRPGREECKTLPGLEGGNNNWKYGWHYLDGDFRNWTLDTIVSLAQGSQELLQYIKDAVEKMLKEMKDNNII